METRHVNRLCIVASSSSSRIQFFSIEKLPIVKITEMVLEKGKVPKGIAISTFNNTKLLWLLSGQSCEDCTASLSIPDDDYISCNMTFRVIALKSLLGPEKRFFVQEKDFASCFDRRAKGRFCSESRIKLPEKQLPPPESVPTTKPAESLPKSSQVSSRAPHPSDAVPKSNHVSRGPRPLSDTLPSRGSQMSDTLPSRGAQLSDTLPKSAHVSRHPPEPKEVPKSAHVSRHPPEPKEVPKKQTCDKAIATTLPRKHFADKAVEVHLDMLVDDLESDDNKSVLSYYSAESVVMPKKPAELNSSSNEDYYSIEYSNSQGGTIRGTTTERKIFDIERCVLDMFETHSMELNDIKAELRELKKVVSGISDRRYGSISTANSPSNAQLLCHIQELQHSVHVVENKLDNMTVDINSRLKHQDRKLSEIRKELNTLKH